MSKAGSLDLRSIRYFLTIVDEGSFARAAQKLDVTQSALSRSVQSLESSLGVKLLDRGKFGAAPTVFGRVLIERGRTLIGDASVIAREISLLSGAETGEIAIGAGTYPGEICVGPATGRLLARRPGIKVRVALGDWPDLTDKVLAETLDLAVCDLANAESDARLRTELLPQHQAVLFCRAGHPLTRNKHLALSDVRRFPLALTTVPSRLAPILFEEAGFGGGPAVPSAHVDTFQLAREIVLHSDAVGGAIPAQIDADIRAGRAVALPLALPWLTTRYGFIYLAGRTLPPSVELFMAEVRAVESELAERKTQRKATRRAASGSARKQAR